MKTGIKGYPAELVERPLKVGDIVRVKKESSTGIPLYLCGRALKIQDIWKCEESVGVEATTPPMDGGRIPLSCLELMEKPEMEKPKITQLQERLTALETEASDIKGKLAWLTASGAAEFDEVEYKCWQALLIAEGSGTTAEKAKALAKLIK